MLSAGSDPEFDEILWSGGATLSHSARDFFSGFEMNASRYAGTMMVACRYDLDLFHPDLFDATGIELPVSLQRAHIKRQADFLVGRALGKIAMGHLTGRAPQVAIGPDRCPIWPPGFSGSISHSKGRAVCFAVGKGARNIGVDIEPVSTGRSLDAILEMTLSAEERNLVQTQTGWPVEILATLVFSAKETLFKTLFPDVKRIFGFACAALVSVPGADRMELALTESLSDAYQIGNTFEIQFALENRHVRTWLLLH